MICKYVSDWNHWQRLVLELPTVHALETGLGWIISSQQLNVGNSNCFERIAKKHSCESDVRACIPELQKRCGHRFQMKIMFPSRLLKWPKVVDVFPYLWNSWAFLVLCFQPCSMCILVLEFADTLTKSCSQSYCQWDGLLRLSFYPQDD